MSKSEYYDYVKRRKSRAQIERGSLEGFVAERLDLHKGRYGYCRINRELRRDGIVVSEKRVLAAMRKLGLQAREASRGHKRAKAVEMGGPRVNLVDRAFDLGARNKLWVGDITYIGTGEGWLCLAAVIDAFHRKVADRQSEGRARPTTSASSSTMTGVPSTLPGRSSAASSPMESPNPCRGRATHGTTRSRNPSSRRSSASW